MQSYFAVSMDEAIISGLISVSFQTTNTLCNLPHLRVDLLNAFIHVGEFIYTNDLADMRHLDLQ